ncbi:hypothetical protein ACE38W_00915 [Chitinophaga sp. Hz27]|uniref:hypothetical protein n=1 Tax=Chitinophaga sp. Hz27 TaxID=3347169 RepID=UPI0035E123C0
MLITEKFEQRKVDVIKRYLQREAEKGRPKEFEIMVDGFKVVPRTDNMDEFEEYEQEITENSRNLSILVYINPNANRNTRHSFSLNGDSSTPVTTPANGLGEIDQLIAQKLDEREKEYELNRLKEQLVVTKTQLTEAEEYADILQKRIKEMEDKRYAHAVSLGEVASVVLKTLVKQHVSRIPGGQVLAGLLGTDLAEDNAIPAPAEVPTPVTFEKASESVMLDEETKNRLSLISEMQGRFNEQQMIAVFSIMDSLVASPEKIDSVMPFLGLQAA